MPEPIHASGNKLFGKSMNTHIITPGELAPDFELEDIHGRLVRLSCYRNDKPIVLAFLRGFL